MRYPPQFLDELKARLPVSEVVGRRVKLRKAGREWKGLSPFNKEKTPSFFVNDQKQAWFDFSSGKNGSIFDFVMETEGVSFPEAVERLAQMAGLPLPRVSAEDDARERKRRTLHDVMELAAKYFEATLASRAGARARGYLADRGIESAMQVRFRLGYAIGERFALKEALGAQGVSVDDMIAAGLLISGDDVPLPYDRFRDRVMFPITDLRGRVIAFGGRALDKDAPAKYLNSPETVLFHKGSSLYNGAAARQAAHDGAPLIVVEGYVDVVAMASVGYAATVAPLGTALTEEQLALLWRMANEPILCFDGDAAGRRAAYRAVDLALPRLRPGRSLRFALLPEGRDPDDLVRAGGREAVAEVLSGARGLADMLWARETEAATFDTPERRAALEARMSEITAAIGDDAVRKYYRRDIEARIAALFEPQVRFPRGGAALRPVRGGGRFAGGGRPAPRETLAPVSPRLGLSPIVRGFRSALPPREALILIAVLNHPWLMDHHAEEFAELEFINPDADVLRRAMLDLAAARGTLEPQLLREAVADMGLGAVLIRVESAITHPSDWAARPGAAAEDVEQFWNQIIVLHRRVRTLNKELKDAERALGENSSEANWARFRDVQGRLSALEGTEALIEGYGQPSGRPVRSL